MPHCIHLMAVHRAVGLPSVAKRRRTNLSALRRKVRAGRKQGRKRGPDSVELCAPDSVQAKQSKVNYSLLDQYCYISVIYYC